MISREYKLNELSFEICWVLNLVKPMTNLLTILFRRFLILRIQGWAYGGSTIYIRLLLWQLNASQKDLSKDWDEMDQVNKAIFKFNRQTFAFIDSPALNWLKDHIEANILLWLWLWKKVKDLIFVKGDDVVDRFILESLLTEFK